jgi:thioredoxin reductase
VLFRSVSMSFQLRRGPVGCWARMRWAAARPGRTAEERTVALDGVFIAIGHRPNTEVFRGWLDMDEKGYLEPHAHSASRIPGVFVAGDVDDQRYRQAVTAAGEGCRAAIDAERWLEEQGVLTPDEVAEAAASSPW